MGKLKRFCMIVFSLATVLGVGILAALWFAWEPLFPAISWLAAMPWFHVAEAALLGITALGALIVLVRALTAPGRRAQLTILRDNGSISITQGAIQSTVRHVVEAHPGLSVRMAKVGIAGKRSPRLSIRAKIDPGRNADLSTLGAKLQDEMSATLEAFAGYPVDSVRITFTGDAEVVTPAFMKQAVKQPSDRPNGLNGPNGLSADRETEHSTDRSTERSADPLSEQTTQPLQSVRPLTAHAAK